MEGADFSGWGTKANLLCSDGVTIMPGAFKGQNQVTVPLVWMHGHDDPTNVLGHAVLEEREGEGTYVHAFFNNTPAAQHMKESVRHKDVTQMSIWANELVKRGKEVVHGKIKEVSLVLAGANPGALIENVMIAHADGYEEPAQDQAIITTGEFIVHAEGEAEGEEKSDDKESGDGKTFQDIIDTMNQEQQDVFYATMGELTDKLDKQSDDKAGDAGEEKADDKSDSADSAAHSDLGKNNAGTTNNEKGNDTMGDSKVEHSNVFEEKDEKDKAHSASHVLSHADKKGIFADAMRSGSMKDAVENYCIQHGIDQMDILFPEAKNPDGATPQWLKRDTGWVEKFMAATTKRPFSKIKNLWADITEDEARAKGYITGSLKKDEFFGVAKRVTNPTTVYKKQKLDRDDVLDITDFDVVAWLKQEMRLMLDEEIARAALIGDGRDIASEDKIDEQCIRPIANEHELFSITVNVNLDDADSDYSEFIDRVIMARAKYKGTGMPTFYTSETTIAGFLLLKDTNNRDLYPSIESLALKLRVREIVAVEVMEAEPDIIGIMVNPADYTFGATRGGEVTLFDQFDIDYNKEKYLIETRLSGSLTRLKSALVFRRTEETDVMIVPAAPTFNADDSEVTIPTDVKVVYKNADTGATLADGSTHVLDENEVLKVVAVAEDGYYFATNDDDQWSFRGVATS